MSTISASTTSTTAFKITTDTTGALVFQTGSTPTTAVTFDGSQNVGVGVSSPSSKLEVAGQLKVRYANPDTIGITLQASTGTNAAAMNFSNTGGNGYVGLDNSVGSRIGVAAYSLNLWHEGAYPICFGTSNAERMRLDASGNLGLGVVPSAWWSSGKAYQVGSRTSLSDLSGDTHVTNNAYYDGTNWKYITSNAAENYYQSAGTHVWRYAGSGTAGANVSWTQPMTLDASGRLSLGTTATSDFTMTIYNTSSTSAGIQCQNSSTGTGSNNGFYVGVSGSGTAGTTGYVWNCENDRISFGTNNIDRARITAAGDFDLYITGPKDGQLRWTAGGGGSVQAYIYANGNPELIAQCGGSGGVKLTSGATSWVSASDIRSKDIIEHITDAVTKVATLSSIIYNFKDDEQQTRRVGLVAQELLEVLPEAVYVPTKEGELLGVRYAEVVPLLVAAIKELNTRLEAVENK